MLAILIAGVSFFAVVAFIALAYRRGWRWTGLAAQRGDGTPAHPPLPAKTLWDWLQLLIIPLVLALAAFALNATQADRDRKQEERRVARDRAIAADRARENTLRAYLQQMSDLITRRRLRSADFAGATASSTLARTLTLIALRRLDAERKSLVVQFLVEADLIETTVHWDPRDRSASVDSFGERSPKVDLAGADLRGVHMRDVLTSYGYGPKGGGFEILGTALDGADLRHADFRGLHLMGVSLTRADLRDADFSGADLNGAMFTLACLSRARFNRASIRRDSFVEFAFADFKATDGRNVDFSRARLDHADFSRATLTDVNLQGARTNGTVWPKGWGPTGIRASVKGPCMHYPP
jgi:uncharacterized protein YjbI with pentapeptide repeats